jgi:lysophospholipase L1-like esterase
MTPPTPVDQVDAVLDTAPATLDAPARQVRPWLAARRRSIAAELRAVGEELAAARRDAAGAAHSLAGTLRRSLPGAGHRARTARTWWASLETPLPARLRRAVAPVDPEPGRARRLLGWRQALAVGCSAFALWLVLDAPTLLRAADASPYGVRRSVAMAVLRPVAAVTDAAGLEHLVGGVDRLLGRVGSGVVAVVGPPTHVHRAARLVGPPAPATDALPPLPAPSTAAPLRVLAVGDSLGVDLAGPFVNDLAATGVVNAAEDAHVDTGLTRPDYFDWPAELQGDLARYQPQAVVVFLGANDPQNMVDGGQALAYGTAGWSAAYARRVGAFMQAATSSGARVLWVGMPPMADPTLDAKMSALDAIFQSQAAAHPGVTYLSSWPVLSAPGGAYAQYLPDTSGAMVPVREPDGTHVSYAGAERLSQAVIAEMDRAWGLALKP